MEQKVDVTAVNKAFFDGVLNEAEKAELQQLADNPLAVQALEKVFLAGIYYQGALKKGEKPIPTRNFTLHLAFQAANANIDDAAIGRDVRAKTEALVQLSTGFNVVEAYKSTPKKPEKKEANPAR